MFAGLLVGFFFFWACCCWNYWWSRRSVSEISISIMRPHDALLLDVCHQQGVVGA
jgi:hypothetical protein